MKSPSLHRPWHSLMAAFLIPLLAFLLACGPGEEPTPIPTATTLPTATPTQAPVSVPTVTSPGPTAIPTPTTQAAPVPTPSEKPKKGGRFLYTTAFYPPDYDVHVTGSTVDMSRIGTWWSNNLFINTKGEQVECEICTEWHLEDAGKTMVFTMIQGVKFHNGQEMTSADVAYSIKKMMGQIDGVISPRIGVLKEYITSIETPSRYQLKIRLVRPSLFVPKVLALGFAIIYPDGTTRAMLKEKPYGSGPYILKEAQTGAGFKFDRNPNYFKPGLPYLDGIDHVIVGDTTTRNAAFLTGKTLILSLASPAFVDQLDRLMAEGKLNLEVPLGGCGQSFIMWPNSKPPTSDIRVRQAISLALDRKALGEVGYENWAVPTLMHYGKGQEYATPEEKIWNVVPGWGTGAKKQQEVEDAKKLLAAAGFPNGMDMEQVTKLPISASYAPETVQQMLGKIGIRTKIVSLDATTHQLRTEAWDYQIQSWQFCFPSRDPDEVVGTYWITGASRNWFAYSNPEVDRLFPLMSGELDPQKRKELFLKIQDIIVLDTVGYAPISRSDYHIWWWKSLKGVVWGLDGYTHNSTGLFRMDRVWLDN